MLDCCISKPKTKLYSSFMLWRVGSVRRGDILRAWAKTARKLGSEKREARGAGYSECWKAWVFGCQNMLTPYFG